MLGCSTPFTLQNAKRFALVVGDGIGATVKVSTLR